MFALLWKKLGMGVRKKKEILLSNKKNKYIFMLDLNV